MNLDKVVSITGKSGLFKIIAETPKRVIVQSLEDPSKKIPVSTNFQIAMLDKITIYTLDGSDLGLAEVLQNMADYDKEEGSELPSPKAKPNELKEFFTHIAPKHDPDKVYTSDIKKIVRWYGILNKIENS